MLAFDYTSESFVDGEIGRQGENVRTSDHDLAHGDAVEFDGVVDHFFLRLGNLAELAAGGDDEFEFVGGGDGSGPAAFGAAEKFQERAAGTAHEKQEGHGQGEERF